MEIEERLKSITLIIFNYDRCVEQFLYYVLQNYYQISGTEAAKLIEQMDIFHPYGTVGSLPWSASDNAGYGVDPKPEQLLELAKRIKTFTEGTDPGSSDFLEMKKHVFEAKKLAFLGFAFHELNMRFLSCREIGNKTEGGLKSYATTYGFSDDDEKVIKDQIKLLYNEGPISMHDVKTKKGTCFKLFDEFKKSLSFL
ncbi:hypothetical protein K8S19_09165 [bacterium]|nr:hypothetical protein [bacterium]